MCVDILGVIITISGIIFFAISIAIIFFGKKVGVEGGQQNIRIGKYVDLQTNSVLALTIITASFSITPLILTYYKPNLAEYISKEELSENYLSKNDLRFEITGAVFSNDQVLIDDVDINVKNLNNDPVSVKKIQEIGYYNIEIDDVKPDQEYLITWSKDGYLDKNFRFRFNFIRSAIYLNKKTGVDQ